MEFKYPTVAVVISNYHEEKYITEAVRSVYEQTYKDWEILVIDDSNGKDDIETYLDWYINNVVHISIYRTDDIGQSALKMFALDKILSKYVLFLDADDKIHPTFLEKTVKLLEENPQHSIAYTDTQHFDGASTFWIQPEYNFHNLLINNFMCACSLIKREDLLAAGGYDLDNFNYWEDYETWIAMGARGFYGKHIPEKLFYYRIRKESGMQSKRNELLAPLYKSHIINRFPILYSKEWSFQAQQIISKYPAGFMKRKPAEQDKFLREQGLMQ